MNKWAAIMKEVYCPTIDYNTSTVIEIILQLPW